MKFFTMLILSCLLLLGSLLSSFSFAQADLFCSCARNEKECSYTGGLRCKCVKRWEICPLTYNGGELCEDGKCELKCKDKCGTEGCPPCLPNKR